MSVKMPWVQVGVLVVDDDFDNLVVLEDEWIHIAVDDFVGRVVSTNAQSSVQRWHIRADICAVVDDKPERC